MRLMELVAWREVMAGGPGSGCRGPNCGRPEGEQIQIKPSARQAFSGMQVETQTKLSKQEAGKLGEQIVIAHLKLQGYSDARPLNLSKNNYTVDLVQDHAVRRKQETSRVSGQRVEKVYKKPISCIHLMKKRISTSIQPTRISIQEIKLDLLP